MILDLMFEMAETDIVSYLQSDMVICHHYDLEILKYLNDQNIISSTRVEPPLHPPSPEKITHDFGLDPKSFDLDAFTNFAEGRKSDQITNYWFAPFTLYRKHWLEIGGHDTLFRRSREDSDLLYRFTMKGLKIEQAWNAIVYHFTCTSSRGIEWWTEKAQHRTKYQQLADNVEMGRFLRKWPSFKHTTTFDASTEYKYPVSVNFKNVKLDRDTKEIFFNYFKFDRIYLDNPKSAEILLNASAEWQHPANFLLNFTEHSWNMYKKYYRTWKPEDIFVSAPITDADVLLEIDCDKMNVFTEPMMAQLNDIIHVSEPGGYEFGQGGTITINRVNNRIQENLVVKNPPIDDISFTIL